MIQCRDCGRLFNPRAQPCVCVLKRGLPAYVVIETEECIYWEAIDSSDKTGDKKKGEDDE